MIQIATVVPTVPTVPVPSALRLAESGASSFALVMSLMLVPGSKAVAGPGEAATPETAVPALQVAAEPGKDLPEAGLELPKDETEAEPEGDASEETPAAQDPAFAWFALLTPPRSEPPPVAIAAAVARAVRVETPEIPAVVPATPNAAAPDARPTSASVTDAAALTDAAPVANAAPGAEAPPAQTEATAPPAIPATRAERGSVAIPRAAPLASGEASPAAVQPMPAAAVPAETAALAPAAPVETRAPAAPSTEMRAGTLAPTATVAPRTPAAPAPEIAGAPALAAAAPAAVQATVPAPLRRAVPREPDQPAITSVAAPSPAALQQVAATADAQRGALDMRRQEWMGQMVERIEALRDAAPIRETRIALMPDALGKVDISVRHDGERVHVHFAAESQAARQILGDAQPRLAEIAESRGIRLGQTSVDLGQAGANPHSGQRQDGQRAPVPSAPPRARAETEFTATEDRVA